MEEPTDSTVLSAEDDHARVQRRIVSQGLDPDLAVWLIELHVDDHRSCPACSMPDQQPHPH